MIIDKYLSDGLQEKYEFYNYNHAVEIITQAFPGEWKDICDTLSAFSLDISLQIRSVLSVHSDLTKRTLSSHCLQERYAELY